MANHQQTINLNDLQNDITSEHYHHQSSSFLLPHPMSLSAEKLDNSVNCCQMPRTSEQQQQQYSANIPYNYQKEQSKADQCQPYPHPCRLTATIDDQQRQRSKSLQSGKFVLWQIFLIIWRTEYCLFWVSPKFFILSKLCKEIYKYFKL